MKLALYGIGAVIVLVFFVGIVGHVTKLYEFRSRVEIATNAVENKAAAENTVLEASSRADVDELERQNAELAARVRAAEEKIAEISKRETQCLLSVEAVRAINGAR